MIDHDRLFKELLSTFFVEFLELFLPEVLQYLEPESLVFLDKELFTDVTAGERKEADLVLASPSPQPPTPSPLPILGEGPGERANTESYPAQSTKLARLCATTQSSRQCPDG